VVIKVAVEVPAVATKTINMVTRKKLTRKEAKAVAKVAKVAKANKQ